MCSILFILLVIIILWIVWSAPTEKLQPWELEKCYQACYQAGQQFPWVPKYWGPLYDPATVPSSTFDVAGCLQACDDQ